jgi:hypothetical protein
MAFGLFSRKRRVEESAVAVADPVVAAEAAPPVATIVVEPDVDPETDDTMLPRWRRPSLLQARRADAVRDAKPFARLSFDQGFVSPVDGHERRFIRYSLVRMLDSPDELRGTELGYLDRGDEVQLLEKYGAYWLVLCPDARQGWVHNMTLGDVVGGAGGEFDRAFGEFHREPIVDPSEDPAESSAADPWTTSEPEDVNTDVLDAYLESRRRGL